MSIIIHIARSTHMDEEEEEGEGEDEDEEEKNAEKEVEAVEEVEKEEKDETHNSGRLRGRLTSCCAVVPHLEFTTVDLITPGLCPLNVVQS